MKIHVTLPQITYNILCRFGDINEVVNKICDLIVTDQMEYNDLPPLQGREGHKQFDVIVTNEQFIELYNSMNDAGKPIRMRRVLQYFVDMELYVEFGWPIVNEPKRNTDVEMRAISSLCGVITTLTKLSKTWKTSEDNLLKACDILREVLSDRKQRFNERERKD